MPRLSAQDTLREFSGEKPPGCCLICGEDTLTAVQLEKRILKKLTEGSALSDTVFDGQALDTDRLADACAFAPMFEPYNVIIIRDLDPDVLPAGAMETLLQILGELAPRVVVLIVQRSVPDYEIKRNEPAFFPKFKKLTALIEKNGILCICEKKNAVTLGKQIMERVRRAGSDISRADAELLANRCLCDSTLIQMELEKLLACADGGEPVTRDMLDALVAALPDADAFGLARAVTGGNAKAALHMLDDLTARAEDTGTILGLLSVLTGNFIDLYRAKLGMNASKTQQMLAAEFGYPKNREFLVGKAMQGCRSMTVPQLRTCIRILRETDKKCKSTRTAPKMLMETAIVRMLRVQRDGSEDDR